MEPGYRKGERQARVSIGGASEPIQSAVSYPSDHTILSVSGLKMLLCIYLSERATSQQPQTMYILQELTRSATKQETGMFCAFSAKKKPVPISKRSCNFPPERLKSMLQKDVNGREAKADFLKKIFEEFMKAFVK